MVVQKAVDNLKERPHEEKKVVAGGIAVFVVIILLVGWGFWFLRKIQQGDVTPTFEGSVVPKEQFDYSAIKDAQSGISDMYKDVQNEFRDARDSAAQNQVPSGGGTTQTTEEDVFGTEN